MPENSLHVVPADAVSAALASRLIRVEQLGLIGYEAAWAYQEQLLAHTLSVKTYNRQATEAGHAPQSTANYLLLCEHPPVYTLGKSGKPEHLLLDEAGLATHGATFHRINRGGDITYHGPGQLVGYPIFDLDNFFTDIHRYLRLLEEAVILTLADYGLQAGRIAGLTGVWFDFEEGAANPRKICAMGVKCSRWVTMHGFALNVNTDLSYFGHIVPCGITDKAVTSMAQELGRQVPLAEVETRLLPHLARLFEAEWLLAAGRPVLSVPTFEVSA
ncbi:lipoyl(octanoyl) transferase LipB [Hymenobacter sp. BT190]|uniref:lipoyl(octanoyl) transferase LipB n=1 Tax=Hymenobacter sp. BT190 TaxID=2763505 RepID=UPI001650ECF0|nr:lipoyl(octanoyl) transferase LipB [Hymenobacter sp. BT190]MBC6699782.1 lipoyl(octanoyl) transferase LipB [Hymenobacter sp. BT190]